jgi:hypothetical protein
MKRTVCGPVACVVVMALAVMAGACSGSGNGADSGNDAGPASSGGAPDTASMAIPESLDRDGYIAMVNHICSEPDLGGDIGQPVGTASSVDEIDAQRDRIETRLDLMQTMPTPEGDDASIDQIVQAYDRVLTALDELSSDIDGDDAQAAVLVSTALGSLRGQVNALVSAYGIDQCTL